MRYNDLMVSTFATNFVFLSNLLDPGAVLFGLVLILFGAAFPLLFVLRRVPDLAYWLMAVLVVLEISLAGSMTLNLFIGPDMFVPEELAAVSSILLTHRWLLLTLPLSLLFLSIVVLAVYGPNIVKKHAGYYFGLVSFSITLSFMSLLMIIFESTI